MAKEYTVESARPKEAQHWAKMGVPISNSGKTIKVNTGFKGVSNRKPRMPKLSGRR